MEPVSGTTPFAAPVPVAERYWTLHPLRLTAWSEGLYSSTNLFVKAAPALPPDR